MVVSSELAYRKNEFRTLPFGPRSSELEGTPHIAGLVEFLLKSGAPHFTEKLYVSRTGPQPTQESVVGDRQLMVVRENGVMLSQRQLSILALLEPEVIGNYLTLTFRVDKAGQSLHLPFETQVNPRSSTLLRLAPDELHPQVSTKVHTTADIPAIDQGDGVAKWLSAILGQEVRVVLQKPSMPRQRAETAPDFSDVATLLRFADSFPCTAMSYQVLDTLNQRLKEVNPEWQQFEPINFRMNLLLAGNLNEHEAVGKYLQVGSVYFYVQRPKPRCIMPAVNQHTGARQNGPRFGSEYQEVLQQLHDELKIPEAWRFNTLKHDGKPDRKLPNAMLGVDLIPINEGYIEVGDKVEVVEHVPTHFNISR